jgi:hypothetical protein
LYDNDCLAFKQITGKYYQQAGYGSFYEFWRQKKFLKWLHRKYFEKFEVLMKVKRRVKHYQDGRLDKYRTANYVAHL